MADDPDEPVADEPDGERREDDGPAARLRDLGTYIREQRNRAQLSLRNTAKLAGVSNPYLSQIERGLRKPSAEILQAIAKALRISAETLYVKAGILEERGGTQDLESAIARDPKLTEPQRQALVEMYRSFRQLAELQEGQPQEDVLNRAARTLEGLGQRVDPDQTAQAGDEAGAEIGAEGADEAGGADASSG